MLSQQCSVSLTTLVDTATKITADSERIPEYRIPDG